MSNLLDQAIIDAEALKEVAMKNAEVTILEKFSDQIKEAVEQILDEEPEEFEAMDDAGLEGEEGVPLPGDEEGADVLSQLSPAGAEGVEMCPCPDVEDEVEITVDLDSLESDLESGHSPGEESAAVADDLGAEEEMPEEEMPLEEGLEIDDNSLREFIFETSAPEAELSLEENILEELMGMLDEDCAEKDEAEEEAAETSAAAPYVASMGESIDINEEELSEIVEEALTVDIDPTLTEKSGWGPPPNAIFELAEEEMLAMLQDSKRREKNEEMQKALKSLQESNNKLESKTNKLKEDKKELMSITRNMKDKLNESNLSNAKLLYTNKVLMSDSLNERQKNKIVEALSNSENVEEAKVIYETLQSATGSTIKNNKPESLSEAMNKTTSTLILSHRKRDRENTTQDDSSLTRWKILAGLNNK